MKLTKLFMDNIKQNQLGFMSFGGISCMKIIKYS